MSAVQVALLNTLVAQAVAVSPAADSPRASHGAAVRAAQQAHSVQAETATHGKMEYVLIPTAAHQAVAADIMAAAAPQPATVAAAEAEGAVHGPEH